MNAFRLPGLVVVIGLLVGGVVLDQNRITSETAAVQLISPVPVVAPEDARSSTWFCAAGTAEQNGLADALVVLANTTVSAKTAIVSVFVGGPTPEVGSEVEEVVLAIDPQSSIDLRLADLAPGSPLVSIAVEIDGGGVFAEKVVSGPTGVDRTSCETEGSPDWVVPSGATVPGARLQLAVFNPFPDDAVVDITFMTDFGPREPSELNGVHIPSRSSRLIEVGDFVAAAETVSSFVHARSGRVVVEAIQSFDGSGDPLGLSVITGVPAPAESWSFPGISPSIGPAQLVVVNPSETLIRVDVEVYPAGGERFVEPFELTLRKGQHAVVPIANEGRLAEIDSFTLVVRSFDGPRIVAGMEQRPAAGESDALADFIDDTEAPRTGFAASPGQAQASTELFTSLNVAEDDTRSAIHLFNPASDTIVTVEATVVAQGATRTIELEVGQQRTLRVPLSDLGTGEFTLRLRSSGPLVGSRETTGLSSRSWAPLLPLASN